MSRTELPVYLRDENMKAALLALLESCRSTEDNLYGRVTNWQIDVFVAQTKAYPVEQRAARNGKTPAGANPAWGQ